MPGRLIGGDALPDDGVADLGVRQILAAAITRLGVPAFGGGTGCTWGFGSIFAKIALSGESRGESG